MMAVLALDTALGACSAAVGDRHRVFAAQYREAAAGQAEHLIPMIASTLQEAGLGMAALTRIGVTIGPGSFTGTRIGLAAARALGLARDIPVIGITTLEALREQAPEEQAALVAFDARKGQIYAQLFDGARTALTPPLALAPERVVAALPRLSDPVTLLGSGAAALAPFLSAAGFALAIDPAPYPVAARFLRAIARRAPEAGLMPRPLYLRPPDAGAPERRAP